VERVSFAHPKLEPNRLFWGDNLHVMRKLPSESIDLIYIDPPFFSGRWHHFRRETRCRDYSAITRAACSVMEVLILLSGSAVNRVITESCGSGAGMEKAAYPSA